MNRDKIWERLKNDKQTVYGKSMLEVFISMTDELDKKHFGELSQKQKELVNPEIRLKYSSTVKNVEEAFKDGAKNLNSAFLDAALMGHTEKLNWIANKVQEVTGSPNWQIAITTVPHAGFFLDFNLAMTKAAKEGHLEICKWLFDKGASIDSALYGAASSGQSEILKWSFKNGAKDFDRALRAAASGGHIKICEWAVEKGASDFINSLIGAAQAGQLKSCKWIVENVNFLSGKNDDSDSWTLINTAQYATNPEVKKYLHEEALKRAASISICAWLVKEGFRDFDFGLLHAKNKDVRSFFLKMKEKK